MSTRTHRWWQSAVFYQIYPRSFQDSNGDGIGDLRGIVSRLDHLQQLGIDAVWLSPMYRSPMVDHGYDICDYEDIDPVFGSMDDFYALLHGLHERGIKLMIDLVVNHTSDQHPWFIESRASRDNPKRDWYIWRDPHNGSEPNNWASHFGGSAWTFDATTGQYYLHLFSPQQPDLNWRNPEVKHAIFAMVRRWIERGVDGFRVDVGHLYLKDPELPDALHEAVGELPRYVHASALTSHQPGLHGIYQELRRDVLGPDIALFGEMYELDPESALEYTRYDRQEFDMVYQYPVVHAKGDWTAVKRSVREWYECFVGQGWNTITFSNHDSARPVSVFGEDTHLRARSAKLIATYLLTAPGTPFFLQGEEIGMTNVRFGRIEDYHDAETIGLYHEQVAAGANPHETLDRLAPWSRDNARTPMQWSEAIQAGFTDSTPWLLVNPNYTDLNVAAQTDNPDSVLTYYQNLIAIRKHHPTLCFGSFEPLVPDHHALYAFVRRDKTATFLVIMNTADHALTPGDELCARVKELGLPGFCIIGSHQQELAWDEEYAPFAARVYPVS